MHAQEGLCQPASGCGTQANGQVSAGRSGETEAPKETGFPRPQAREVGCSPSAGGVVGTPPAPTPPTDCCSQTVSGSPPPPSQIHLPEDVRGLGPPTAAALRGTRLFLTVPGAPVTTTATTMYFGEPPGVPVLCSLPPCQSPLSLRLLLSRVTSTGLLCPFSCHQLATVASSGPTTFPLEVPVPACHLYERPCPPLRPPHRGWVSLG